VNWQDLEVDAPEIAELGRDALMRARVGLLGTLRRNGSPRISPIEPYFSGGHLLFGAMAWSLKVRDLRRDPRCVLHSAITGPDSGEGELKLYGRAEEADDRVRAACAEGWWVGKPPESAFVFSLNIEEAAFIKWDYERDEMIARRWSPASGFRTSRRSYP
jgi:hypothetical protein